MARARGIRGALDWRRALPFATLGSIIAAWEILVRALDVPRFILPPPSAVVVGLFGIRDIIIDNAAVTILAIGLGYGVGALLGLSLAILMTWLPVLRAALYPLVLATQTTPKIAIAPLLIIWFGVGILPKIVIVALLAFFPVLINTITGLESADRGQLDLLRSVDASRRQVYWHIRLPAAVPYIFAGLRLALTVSVIGAIVGEWVASNQGLGYLLVYYNAVLRTTDLFAVLVVLIALAALAFTLIGWVERRLSWDARINRSAAAVTRAGGEAGL